MKTAELIKHSEQLREERAPAVLSVPSVLSHTPGPWQVHTNIGKRSELGIVADAAPCIIACMANAKEWPAEAHANARLIAAAPELLAALQNAVACLEACEGDCTADCWDAIEQDLVAFRAAIAKATGGQQ